MKGLWDLPVETASLTQAAESWRAISRRSDEAADDFAANALRALVVWEGAAAESFAGRRSQLITDLDTASALANECGAVLDAIAYDLTAAQDYLHASWSRVSSVRYTLPGPVFLPETPEESEVVTREQLEAHNIRSELDQKLFGHRQALTSLEERWTTLSSTWETVAAGEPFMDGIPDEGSDVGVIVDGDNIVLSAGKGNNVISVTVDPNTGEQIVTVDGKKYVFPAGKHVTIRAGSGNDTITLPPDTTVGFTVVGGKGQDRITGGGGADRIFGSGDKDEIVAGGGADYVSGGTGIDYIDGQGGDDRLFGGYGRDTLYGLGGRDRLSGGAGADYLEGGADTDHLVGGSGDDVTSGGAGDDHIVGGSGNDVVYGGRGADKVSAGAGDDTVYDDAAQSDTHTEHHVQVAIEDMTSWITIEGSPDFIERVRADLDLLASSPAGAQLLANIERSHDKSGIFGFFKNTLTITEYIPDNPDFPNSTASYRGGTHEVAYQPTIHDFRGAPPIVVLQHELSHIDSYMSGNFRGEQYVGQDSVDHGSKVGERQAVGLPIDHDNDPTTPEIIDPTQPIERTENGLREEMRLPRRKSYE
ncbi:M91 family zinc metallopeptidase [Schaalia suimastitidis]|uniref:M91 family zinc metallopeptidase n=1 Tax=Schaalia suimastitidis TaxID=121163 RepID=UPI00041F0837|nr:M91 family zinc metallopeptidase [Schaalia suimastitidis]